MGVKVGNRFHPTYFQEKLAGFHAVLANGECQSCGEQIRGENILSYNKMKKYKSNPFHRANTVSSDEDS